MLAHKEVGSYEDVERSGDFDKVIFQVGNVQVMGDCSLREIPRDFKKKNISFDSGDSDSVGREDYEKEMTAKFVSRFDSVYPKGKPMNILGRLLIIFDSLDNIHRLNVLYDELRKLNEKTSLSRPKWIEATLSGKVKEFNESQGGIAHQDATLQLIEKNEEIENFLGLMSRLRTEKKENQDFSFNSSLNTVDIRDDVVKILEANPEGEILASSFFADGNSESVELLLRCGDSILRYSDSCQDYGPGGNDVSLRALKVQKNRA